MHAFTFISTNTTSIQQGMTSTILATATNTGRDTMLQHAQRELDTESIPIMPSGATPGMTSLME
jgi:hypothetical protein